MSDIRKGMEELKNLMDTMAIDEQSKEQLNTQLNHFMQQVKQWEEQSNEMEHMLYEKAKRCDFLEASINALPNPIFLKNSDGEFVYFNEAYQKYFNMKQEVYIGKTVLDLGFLPIEDRERYQAEDLKLIDSGEIKHYDADFELAGGEVGHSLYWSKGFEVSDGGDKGLVGEIVDITIQKKLRDELKNNAEKLEEANKSIERMMKEDFLTGLFNRRAIDEIMLKMQYMLKNRNISISILMADLDNFKKVNDTYGHTVGDEVLVKFSEILRSCNRRDDLVVRFGGEEFLVVLFETIEEEALEVAERIRCATEEMLILPSGKMNTVSIGVTEISPDELFDTAIERVDGALYEAKRTGKNKVVLGKKGE